MIEARIIFKEMILIFIGRVSFILLFFVCACGGEVLDDAQNFVPNETPVISSISFEPSDPTLINYEDNLIPDIPFIVRATAYDPEKEGLTYTFTSDNGSFAGQKESNGEVEVVFVTGKMKSGEQVTVKLTVSDPTRRNNEAVEEIYIGKAKPKANISIMNGGSPVLAGNTINLARNGSCPLTLTSDCTGSFLFIENDAETNPNNISIGDKDKVFGLETPTGTNKSLTATLYGPDAIIPDPNHMLKVSSVGTHKVWIIFEDMLGQKIVILCNVIVSP